MKGVALSAPEVTFYDAVYDAEAAFQIADKSTQALATTADITKHRAIVTAANAAGQANLGGPSRQALHDLLRVFVWSMPTSSEGKAFPNISATTAAFALEGGKYGASAVATFGGGSVKLQTLLADGSTWQSVSSATDFTAAGYGVIDLAPGQYRFTVATATAVYCAVTRVPA
jgi:inosine-uridine nucleoside N-ribohydrolase